MFIHILATALCIAGLNRRAGYAAVRRSAVLSQTASHKYSNFSVVFTVTMASRYFAWPEISDMR